MVSTPRPRPSPIPRALVRSAACALAVALVTAAASPAARGVDDAAVAPAAVDTEGSAAVVIARLPSGTLGVDAATRDAVLGDIERAAGDVGLQRRRTIVPLDAVTYAVDGDVDAAARQLAGVAAVDEVEVDEPVAAHRRVPNDPRWNDQWGLRQVGAPTAWTATTGRDDVTIAVLDTGVDTAHPDLDGNVERGLVDTLTSVLIEDVVGQGANFSGDGLPTDTSDLHGHGTASAGVADADTDNAAGVAGACWRCGILPVKVLGDDGGGVASDVAAGIVYAVDAGADVLSLSLGATSSTTLLRDAVDYAAERDALVVASAGNYGTDAPVFPAALPNAVGVAASDRDDARFAFSSYGDWVEVAAPGCNPATDLADGYKRFCGTSSAAPVVAGVAGLARSLDGSAGVDRLRQAFAEAAVDFDGAEWGRVDAAATLAALPDTEPREDDDVPDDDVPDDRDDDRAELDDPDDDVHTDPGVTLRRIAGADRFATAARLSFEAYGDEEGLLGDLLGDVLGDTAPQRVYLTSGLTFADALAAGPVAGSDGAPVLLTAPDTLPQPTADELDRLDPDEIVVVGGSSSVSPATAAAAASVADADTTRVAGRDRYATAAQLAVESFPDGADVAYVATGLDYADALAGVPAAVVDNGPLLLTGPQRLPDAVAAALDELGPERIVVLGGTNAVSTGVAVELDGHASAGVQRLAGATRFATAATVADRRFDEDTDVAYLATGGDFPDALAAGPVAGRSRGPLLLVTRDDLPAVTADQLRRLTAGTNVTMGGAAVISDTVQARAAAASTAGLDDS